MRIFVLYLVNGCLGMAHTRPGPDLIVNQYKQNDHAWIHGPAYQVTNWTCLQPCANNIISHVFNLSVGSISIEVKVVDMTREG